MTFGRSQRFWQSHQTFRHMLYARMNQLMSYWCVHWVARKCCSKNVSVMHASSQMGNYTQKKLARMCCLSNLPVDHFFGDNIVQFGEFSVWCFTECTVDLDTSDFQTASPGVCWMSPLHVASRDRPLIVGFYHMYVSSRSCKRTVIIAMLSGLRMISTLLWLLHCFAIFCGDLIIYSNEMWSRDLVYTRQQLIELCTTRLTFSPTAEVCHTIESMKLRLTRGCRAGRRVRLRRRRMFTLTQGIPSDELKNDVIPVITGNRPWNRNPVTSFPQDRKASRWGQHQLSPIRSVDCLAIQPLTTVHNSNLLHLPMSSPLIYAVDESDAAVDANGSTSAPKFLPYGSPPLSVSYSSPTLSPWLRQSTTEMFDDVPTSPVSHVGKEDALSRLNSPSERLNYLSLQLQWNNPFIDIIHKSPNVPAMSGTFCPLPPTSPSGGSAEDRQRSIIIIAGHRPRRWRCRRLSSWPHHRQSEVREIRRSAEMRPSANTTVSNSVNSCIPVVLTANIRGALMRKTDELEAVLITNSIEIACITETWLNESVPSGAVLISGYILHRNDRSDGRRGGRVAVYVREDIPC